MSNSKSACSIVEEFCNDTSAHGLGRILPVKNRARTVIWSFLFVVAVGMLSFEVSLLLWKFQSRPLATLITMESKTSLFFPEVTICNVNMIKSSFLYNKSDFDYLSEASSESFDGRYDAEYFKKEEILAYLAAEDNEYLSTMGHQFKDMVKSCTFNGRSCRNESSWFWTKFWHYKFGNCFIFNSGRKLDNGTKPRVLKSSKPGLSHGLAIELNIEQDEYFGELTEEAGIRIDISDQGEMPFPLEKGMSLAPGYATMIGLKRILIKRADPGGTYRCSKETSTDKYNVYTKMFNTTYSLTSCKESCLAGSQWCECGCMEYRFPHDENEAVCSLKNHTQMKCVREIQNQYNENKLNCSDMCPPPCRSVDFKRSTSFAAWPSEIYKEYNDWDNFNESDYGRINKLKLYVFYEDFDVEVIAEHASYKLEDFVSDFGGQLGLWIGFSMLTVAEFLEFLMSLCHFVVTKCTKRKQVTMVTPD
ncbi:hypothetical protein ACROYT_G000192 [Oculina patagonica]